jgi:hypothetical protein
MGARGIESPIPYPTRPLCEFHHQQRRLSTQFTVSITLIFEFLCTDTFSRRSRGDRTCSNQYLGFGGRTVPNDSSPSVFMNTRARAETIAPRPRTETERSDVISAVCDLLERNEMGYGVGQKPQRTAMTTQRFMYSNMRVIYPSSPPGFRIKKESIAFRAWTRH